GDSELSPPPATAPSSSQGVAGCAVASVAWNGRVPRSTNSRYAKYDSSMTMATRTLSSSILALSGTSVENNAGSNRPDTASSIKAVFRLASRTLNLSTPWRRPPTSSASPSNSRVLPTMLPVIDALTSVNRPCQGQQGDDQFGRVAEGGIQQSAELRSQMQRHLAGSVADQPRQRHQAQARQPEHHQRRRP